MSTPIKKCEQLFERIVLYQGLHKSPTIPKARLYIAIAGMSLSERKRSFTPDDIKKELKRLGYDARTYYHPSTYAQQFPDLVRHGVFLQRKDGRYTFNKNLLKKSHRKITTGILNGPPASDIIQYANVDPPTKE